MASLPQPQRSSASSRSSQTSSALNSPNSTSHEQEDTLVNSSTEPVLLNPEPASEKAQESDASAIGPSIRPDAQRQDSVDVRRCWICFSDETDDTPLSSSWRSPCPCALTAHESCILDWVADLEGSNNGRSKKIQCPQCKSDILIARPRNLIVDAVRGLELAASKAVLPGILLLGSSTILYLSLSYGVIAVHTVLGPYDFNQIFDLADLTPAQSVRRLTGFSILPWTLILSRTSIADSILPIIPMFFFVTQPHEDPLVDISSWPPSAGLSFALLPYARAAYNAYYDYFWADKVKRWIEEVKPRATTSTAQSGDLELEIGVDEDDDDDDFNNNFNDNENENDANIQNPLERFDIPADDPIPPPPAGDIAHPLHEPPLDAQQPNNGQLNAHLDIAANPAAPNGIRHRRDYSISVSRVMQSVLGALVFPGVSAAMGHLLTIVLPRSWTFLPITSRSILGRTIETRAKPWRFLQTQWGRSIVGGCLFVVLRDAVTLYVRWKMAQSHRQRKVVDYDKSKAKRKAKS
ncbi:hypothetical protein BT63DRAFT_111435 [Microthyrium microscopicum]|uniref:Uncharacterized protein n=1 Tax=Microthyrium microscopicum TaxID=703497 RepID=A0A6A6TXP6_9PEZI|nr:hypothetical protein BT63DRAFT_111435 [Microthyrium microscopicum]